MSSRDVEGFMLPFVLGGCCLVSIITLSLIGVYGHILATGKVDYGTNFRCQSLGITPKGACDSTANLTLQCFFTNGTEGPPQVFTFPIAHSYTCQFMNLTYPTSYSLCTGNWIESYGNCCQDLQAGVDYSCWFSKECQYPCSAGPSYNFTSDVPCDFFCHVPQIPYQAYTLCYGSIAVLLFTLCLVGWFIGRLCLPWESAETRPILA